VGDKGRHIVRMNRRYPTAAEGLVNREPGVFAPPPIYEIYIPTRKGRPNQSRQSVCEQAERALHSDLWLHSKNILALRYAFAYSFRAGFRGAEMPGRKPVDLAGSVSKPYPLLRAYSENDGSWSK
jgi:hypothetical protein